MTTGNYPFLLFADCADERGFASKEVTADHHVVDVGFMSRKKRQTPG